METPRAAASRIDEDSAADFALLVAMRMAVYYQVIVGDVPREILFLVRHVNMQATEREVKKERDVLGPLLVIVAADHIDGSDDAQLIDDLLSVDITSV